MSEPSLQAIADNLRQMTEAFARTPVGRQEITPGGGTTIADVLRFMVPQSEGDLALEAAGGPAGKAIGHLLSVVPMGVLKRISRQEVLDIAETLRPRVRESSAATSQADDLMEVLAEILHPALRSNRAGGEIFDLIFEKGGRQVEMSLPHAAGGLARGMSPEQIRESAEVLTPVLGQIERKPPLARLFEPEHMGIRREGTEALDELEFEGVDLVINPRTGEPEVIDEFDILDLIDRVRARSPIE